MDGGTKNNIGISEITLKVDGVIGFTDLILIEGDNTSIKDVNFIINSTPSNPLSLIHIESSSSNNIIKACTFIINPSVTTNVIPISCEGDYTRILDCYVDGKTTLGSFLFVSSCFGCTVSNCKFLNMDQATSAVIQMQGDACHIINNTISGTAAIYAIHLYTNANRNFVTNNYIDGLNEGILLAEATYNIINNNICYNCQQRGIRLTGNADQNIINNNIVTGSTTLNGIYAESGSVDTIMNNNIIDNIGTTAVGIEHLGINKILSNNLIKNQDRSIFVKNSNTVISGNISDGSASTTIPAITFQRGTTSERNLVISGNVIERTGTAGDGIELASEASDTTATPLIGSIFGNTMNLGVATGIFHNRNLLRTLHRNIHGLIFSSNVIISDASGITCGTAVGDEDTIAIGNNIKSEFHGIGYDGSISVGSSSGRAIGIAIGNHVLFGEDNSSEYVGILSRIAAGNRIIQVATTGTFDVIGINGCKLASNNDIDVGLGHTTTSIPYGVYPDTNTDRAIISNNIMDVTATATARQGINFGTSDNRVAVGNIISGATTAVFGTSSGSASDPNVLALNILGSGIVSVTNNTVFPEKGYNGGAPTGYRWHGTISAGEANVP
jgi:parallel beta-helix repeat protein